MERNLNNRPKDPDLAAQFLKLLREGDFRGAYKFANDHPDLITVPESKNRLMVYVLNEHLAKFKEFLTTYENERDGSKQFALLAENIEMISCFSEVLGRNPTLLSPSDREKTHHICDQLMAQYLLEGILNFYHNFTDGGTGQNLFNNYNSLVDCYNACNEKTLPGIQNDARTLLKTVKDYHSKLKYALEVMETINNYPDIRDKLGLTKEQREGLQKHIDTLNQQLDKMIENLNRVLRTRNEELTLNEVKFPDLTASSIQPLFPA